MNNCELLKPDSYTPVGDIIVVSLCMIMAVLIGQTNINRNRKFRSIIVIIMLMWVASASHIVYNMLIYSGSKAMIPICILRTVHNIMLSFVPCMYIQYLHTPLWIPDKNTLKYRTVSAVFIPAIAVFDLCGTAFGYGFYMDEFNVLHNHFNAYTIFYVLTLSSVFYSIIKYRSRVIRPVFFGLMGINIVSLSIMIIQALCRQTSYTCIAYFFPIIGIIFMFHSNPYNIETGAVSGNFFVSEINDCIEKKKSVVMLYFTIKGFTKSKEIKYELRRIFHRNIKKGVLYHFPDEHLILTVPKKSNVGYERSIDSIISEFKTNVHDRFGTEYKMVILETDETITESGDYLKIADYIEHKMMPNEVHTVTDDDISGFYSSNYILSQLEDIVQKNDLNDERVLVYCQPVFNLLTNSYDTAEALMRLKLEKTGMVFPDKFIPIAEQYNMIHTLSMIILNKTCRAVSELVGESYELNRISVNFSALDIKYESFCGEVENIISRNGIPYDKIAVEITESRSEADFNVMREKVMQLQGLGIKFYLDDFGTGYSNFERIMEIPFNIIKFDRSMLVESSKNDSSKFMVSTFANMFNQLNYAVLFEGVEDDNDELHCVNMQAKYLQGYKYSKPIPIEQLRNFLSKSAV